MTSIRDLAGLCKLMENSTFKNSSAIGHFWIYSNVTVEYFGGCVCILKDSIVSRVNGNLNVTLNYHTNSVGDLSVGLMFGGADGAVCSYIEVTGKI